MSAMIETLIGQHVRVFYNNGSGYSVVEGILNAVEDTWIHLMDEKGPATCLAITYIIKIESRPRKAIEAV